MTLCALLVACGNPNQRLDEYVFYNGPQFRLKVVRYYRNIPFNYLGEHAIVMCQSENTTKFPAHDQQDAGWRMLGTGSGQGSKDAREAALRVKNDYEVFDDRTLIAKINIFNISFDACGHFINWDPTRLPPTMIDAVQKPDSCAPDGPLDCRYYDFAGDRTPRYERIHIAAEGHVSFSARSKTFKGVELLRVQTRNNGAVWHVETVGLGAGKQRLDPDSVRSVSMPLLEKGMKDVSLLDWLESALPPRSMVIWPDALTACDEPQGTDRQTRFPLCAEIRFNDSDGNSGTLSIAMAVDTENTSILPSFHSAAYTHADQNGLIRSLTGLRERLAAGAS